jgi:two-component system phosphate regulon sensor histidine kinase PhoR
MPGPRVLLLLSVCLAGAAIGVVISGVSGAFIAGAGVAGFVATGLTWIYLLKPMEIMADAADQMAHDDLSVDTWPRAPGPAGRLADAFNELSDRVQDQVADTSRERSRLAAALNSSVDAVAALDRDGRVLFANRGFEQLVARQLADIVGQPLAYSLADPHVLDAVRSSREGGDRSVTLVERPGHVYLQVVTSPITGGGDWSVLVVCHDVSDVKRTEAIRRDFVANVSHELRTPLAAVKSVVETLAEGALDDETVAQEFLRRADQEVDRLVLLVEELLELSRIESGEQPLLREETDVANLLTEVTQRMRSQSERTHVGLSLELAPDLGTADIDGSRIERAVLNLVQNALKFTPPGGNVTVAARREDGDLVIEVTDTGIGIESRDLPRIFERFYKVDQSRASVGSGLGLALVKHAVEAHGGHVTVQSTPGHGSTFSLLIPAEPTSTRQQTTGNQLTAS